MPTYLIGATLLRGEWETAVSMILDPREGDILCCFSNLVFISLTTSNSSGLLQAALSTH